MNKSFSILTAIIVGVFCFALGRGIGLWCADQLRGTGGMITADNIIECTYVLPAALAIIGAYISYYLTRDKNT